ncbi:MAG TPA: extensin, partial [Variovorax sp.]|nr:extensin [Variovorax sp.]
MDLDPFGRPAKPTPSRVKRWLGMAAACAALALGAWAVATGTVEIPERFNPWAPLDVAAPPDWLTGFKLERA